MNSAKPIAAALISAMLLLPMADAPANAGHRHHRDGDSVADVAATLLIGGLLVAAAVTASANDYIGAPYGVIETDFKPHDAQVIVNGVYVGKARKFDGWPGYLPLDPGTYFVEFRYPGYAPFRKKVRVLAGRRLVIRKQLRPLPPGARESAPLEPQGPRTSPPAPPENQPDSGDWRWPDAEPESPSRQPQPLPEAEDLPDPEYLPEGDRSRPEAQGPPPRFEQESTPESAPDDLPDTTELRLEITPDDASIYIDGEFYINARDLDGGSRAILLSPGSYQLDVVRPGYKSQNFTVVLNGAPRTLKVRMEKQ